MTARRDGQPGTWVLSARQGWMEEGNRRIIDLIFLKGWSEQE